MKTKTWMLFSILAALVILGAAACSGEAAPTPTQAAADNPIVTVVVTSPPEPTAEAASATDTPLPEPTAVSEPTAETEPTLDLADIASVQLDSYRATTIMTVSGTKDGKQIDTSIEVTTEFVRDPIAQHSTVTSTNSESVTQTGTIEIYQVEGMQYMLLEDQWISTPFTDTSSIESQGLFSAAEVLDGGCGWEDRGKENLDGLRVQHWSLAETAAQECFASLDLEDAGKVTQAEGDMYVAVEGGYVTSMELSFEGTELPVFGSSDSALLDQGRMVISLSMTDVNQPITIQVPDAALEASALPEDIPMYPGATGGSQMPGLITFTSTSTAEQVRDWYLAEMPALGWTAGEVTDIGDMYSFSFTKEGRKADFFLGPAGGVTSVMITASEDQ